MHSNYRTGSAWPRKYSLKAASFEREIDPVATASGSVPDKSSNYDRLVSYHPWPLHKNR
jgi:hypothetical protein